MAKLFKLLVGIGLSLVIILIALVIAIPLLINPNDYKTDIEQLVLEQTGRQLNINGDIDLSFSSCLLKNLKIL